jgi:uncharacterized protein YbjQ (UPF0145 family)
VTYSKLAAVTAVCLAISVAPAAAPAAEPAGKGDVLVYALKRALADPKVAAKLAPEVKLYFADQPATVVRQIGPTESKRVGVRPARRTPIGEACARVAGNALIALSQDAKAKGGNAVVGIRSNYQDKAPANPQQFECALGAQMIAVHLTGTIAIVE